MSSALIKAVGIVCAIWLFAIVAGFQILKPLRPQRTDVAHNLFPGVLYERTAARQPRPVQVHVVTIDLAVADPEIVITTPDRSGNEEQYDARTTSQFLHENRLQLAVNGGFFYPFWSQHPFSFYPRLGDPVTPLGVTIANGTLVQNRDYGDVWVLCIDRNEFSVHNAFCPLDTNTAISGNLLYVRDFVPALPPDHISKPLPRTMLAFNNAQQKLWLVVADGRQPLYSRGLTLLEMQQIAVDLGAEGAINLDGGGSSTLVIVRDGQPYTLNAPIHTRVPMRQRPIASHIGLRVVD